MSSVAGVAFIMTLHAERISNHLPLPFISFVAPLVSIFFIYLFGVRSLILSLVVSWVVRQSGPYDVSAVAMLAIRDMAIGLAASVLFWFLSKREKRPLDLDEDGFRSVLRAIPDLLLILDRNGNCVGVLNASVPSNWPMGSLVGKKIDEIMRSTELEKSLDAIRQVYDTGEPRRFPSVSVNVEDATEYYSVRIIPIILQGQRAVLWAARDVTEFKETQLRHRDSDELLRNLLRLQERERKLISCEIHDGVLQQIIVSHMMAQLIETKVSGYNDDDINENLATLKLTLTEAIEEGRNLIQELRPIMVDEQSVVDAIGYLVKEESNRGRMRFTFEFEGDFDELTPLLEGNIFRIAQEALTNVRRHSGAQVVDVDLRLTAKSIWLRISDDGVGFDTSSIDDTSFGLKSITRRAQLFGGVAKIESSPGKGTDIHVELPIELTNGLIAS